MEKCLLLFLSVFCLAGCGDDGPVTPDPDSIIDELQKTTFLDCLAHNKWIYDHPDIPTWEEWNVFDDGVMYYSNASSFIYTFSNKDVKCRYVYSIENDAFLVQTEKLGTVEGVISKWDKYEFTWKTADGSFAYNCLLETDTIANGSTFEPAYSRLISDATISGYSSHNPSIAEVNASGKITAKNQGRTYIDVVTDKGTAVMEIYVDGFFSTDYVAFLNNSHYNVVSILGEPTTADNEKLEYIYNNGNFSKTDFYLNDSKNVSKISLTMAASSKSFITSNDVIAYLSENFHEYTKASASFVKYYTNNEDPDKATILASWNKTPKVLTFEYVDPIEKIISNYESKNGEYPSLLGKDKSTIVSKSGSNAFYVASTDLWYTGKEVHAKDYKYVIFSLDEPTTRAYSISLYLNANPDYEEIKEYLTTKYYVFEKGTNAEQLTFIDAEELSNSTMGITVDLVNGLISFVDLSYSYDGSGYGAKAAMRSGTQNMFFNNPKDFIPNLKKVMK